MQNSQSTHLRTSCERALADDNLEHCLKLLLENVPRNSEVLQHSGKLNGLLREKRQGTISRQDYVLERNKLRHNLIEFLAKNFDKLEVSELLNMVTERILVVECKESSTNWHKIFPESRFLNVGFMKYDAEIPEGFNTPDVVIFDDYNCGEQKPNKDDITGHAKKFPQAHLLYFGETKPGNPFQDSKTSEEKAIFARMGNANSHISIHARLNELIEFRKNYGPPLSTVILENMKKGKFPLKVFISYSHKDEEWKTELEMHLASMKLQGLIEVWHDRKVKPGDEWNAKINTQLENSHLILFLISVNFINSDYILKNEVPVAMNLRSEGKATVIPIFTKEVDIKGTSFEKLQGLPRDSKFLANQPNRDQILATVAKELRDLVENWK